MKDKSQYSHPGQEQRQQQERNGNHPPHDGRCRSPPPPPPPPPLQPNPHISEQLRQCEMRDWEKRRQRNQNQLGYWRQHHPMPHSRFQPPNPSPPRSRTFSGMSGTVRPEGIGSSNNIHRYPRNDRRHNNHNDNFPSRGQYENGHPNHNNHNNHDNFDSSYGDTTESGCFNDELNDDASGNNIGRNHGKMRDYETKCNVHNIERDVRDGHHHHGDVSDVPSDVAVASTDQNEKRDGIKNLSNHGSPMASVKREDDEYENNHNVAGGKSSESSGDKNGPGANASVNGKIDTSASNLDHNSEATSASKRGNVNDSNAAQPDEVKSNKIEHTNHEVICIEGPPETDNGLRDLQGVNQGTGRSLTSNPLDVPSTSDFERSRPSSRVETRVARSNSMKSDLTENSGGGSRRSRSNSKTVKKDIQSEALMTLTPEHASRTKFPPGCCVAYNYHRHESSANKNQISTDDVILSLGVVRSVSIDLSSSIRELIHTVEPKRKKRMKEEDEVEKGANEGGDDSVLFIGEHELAYAPQCPVFFQSEGKDPAEAIVLLCRWIDSKFGSNEMKMDIDGEDFNEAGFVYTLLVEPSHSEEYAIKHDVGHENISFRPSDLSTAASGSIHAKMGTNQKSEEKAKTTDDKNIHEGSNGAIKESGQNSKGRGDELAVAENKNVRKAILPCPKSSMRFVIGKQGKTIDDVQKRSGCSIQKQQSGPNCKLIIEGEKEAVDKAKQILQEIIEKRFDHPYAGGRGCLDKEKSSSSSEVAQKVQGSETTADNNKVPIVAKEIPRSEAKLASSSDDDSGSDSDSNQNATSFKRLTKSAKSSSDSSSVASSSSSSDSSTSDEDEDMQEKYDFGSLSQIDNAYLQKELIKNSRDKMTSKGSKANKDKGHNSEPKDDVGDGVEDPGTNELKASRKRKASDAVECSEFKTQNDASIKFEQNLHVLVQNLSWKITDEEIHNHFADCGEIRSICWEKSDKNKKKSAVIEFKTPRASAAATEKNKTNLNGHLLRVTYKRKDNFTVFVSNLPMDADELEVSKCINETFKCCGDIKHIRLVKKKNSKLLGYGHVEFASFEAVKKALSLAGEVILGRSIRVKYATGDPNKKKETPNKKNKTIVKGKTNPKSSSQKHKKVKANNGKMSRDSVTATPNNFRTKSPKANISDQKHAVTPGTQEKKTSNKHIIFS